MKKKKLVKFTILGLSFSNMQLYALDIGASVVESYHSLYSEKLEQKTFLWNGATEGIVGATTQNWNTLSAEDWGTVNRSTDPETPVQPYSITDQGFKGPDNENYGVEIEYGYTKVEPRSSGSASVRFYTDFGQTGIVNSGIDRAEIHIRSTLQKMELKEGDTIWLGWSEYFTHLDTARSATIFQFRNQPDIESLEENGFNDKEVNEIVSLGLTDSGPACAVGLESEGNILRFRFAAREGTPTEWELNNQHVVEEPVQVGRWYDFVVKMKYSQNSDGEFRVWLYDPRIDSNYMVSDDPEWDHKGNTMYTYPEDYNIAIPSPEFRVGLYRWEAKSAVDVDNSNRYMAKLLGPLRLWVGSDDEGFEYVRPRN